MVEKRIFIEHTAGGNGYHESPTLNAQMEITMDIHKMEKITVSLS